MKDIDLNQHSGTAISKPIMCRTCGNIGTSVEIMQTVHIRKSAE